MQTKKKEQKKKHSRHKGKGWFVNEHGIIYVQGSINGKFVRKSTGLRYTPKNEAYVNRYARDLLIELTQPKIKSNDFASFARMVIEQGKKKKGKKGGRGELAQRDAISKLERLIIPYFQSYSLEEIKVVHIELWVDKLMQKYSTSTVSKCVNLLREVMHKAVANDICIKNPVDYIDKIEVVHKKQKAYSVEDARKMMTQSEGFMKVWLNLAFTTGMRTGELMALMWDDIDFENRIIFLQRSITKGYITLGSANTKNHKRIVPLMPQVVEILKEAKTKSKSKWVFPNRKGECYKESKAITKKYFKPLLEKLGIEYISLYATRHTFATIVENAMLNPEAINDIIGNSQEVRNKHYVDFQITKERVDAAHQSIQKVSNIFYLNTENKVN